MPASRLRLFVAYQGMAVHVAVGGGVTIGELADSAAAVLLPRSQALERRGVQLTDAQRRQLLDLQLATLASCDRAPQRWLRDDERVADLVRQGVLQLDQVLELRRYPAWVDRSPH